MLKFLLKTGQKTIVPYKHACQWRGKHVRLLQPARAVAELAAHGLLRGIVERQREMALVTGLSTCSECFEWLVPGRLF